MRLLKNYSGMIFMLLGIAVGAVVGIAFKEAALAVKPIGDIFMNLLFVLVVPMVFFSVSSSFCHMKQGGNVGKTLTRAGFSFVILWLIGGILAYISGLLSNPVGNGFIPPENIKMTLERGDWAESFTRAVSVPDFPQLFSKFSLLPLIIFSSLLGLGVAASGEKGRSFASFLESGNEVIIKTLGILMKAAPIGLGCYFSSSVASLGTALLGGYFRVFVLYCITSAVVFFIVNPLLVLLKMGKKGPQLFWRSTISPSLVALATSSSSAAMPGNIKAAREMGLSDEVSETVIPLATNLLKAGSVMCSVYKIIFIILLSGGSLFTIESAVLCIGTAILAAIVSGAVTNGGVTGDILACSIMGVDPSMVGIIMIIGTICDIPATVLNSQSTVIAATLSEK